MILTRLDKKEVEKVAAEHGWTVESDQNGVRRIVMNGVVISADGAYSTISVSVAAKPQKVTKYRLTTTVKTKDGSLEVTVGDFDKQYEASDYASEANLPENNYKVTEIEVEEVV